jgi:hypothetical protein
MGYFDPPRNERVLREFTIHRDTLGHWVASETHGIAPPVVV